MRAKVLVVSSLMLGFTACGPPTLGTGSTGQSSGGSGPQLPGPAPENTFNGTVSGLSFEVKEAFMFPYVYQGAAVGTTLVLSSTTGLCNELRAGRILSSATHVGMTLFFESSSGYTSEASVGSWTVTQAQDPGAGQWAYAFFGNSDAACKQTVGVDATSGFVSLDAYDKTKSKAATGTFDITWGTDRTTGKFTATFCDLPNGLPSNPTCTRQQ